MDGELSPFMADRLQNRVALAKSVSGFCTYVTCCRHLSFAALDVARHGQVQLGLVSLVIKAH